MPKFKLEIIRGQSRPDWFKQPSLEANIDDLDSEAIAEEEVLDMPDDATGFILPLNYIRSNGSL